MKNVYIAAPLFSEADRMYNEELTKRIEALGFNCYLPQRNPDINDKTKSADSVSIFEADAMKLDEAEIIVFLLDGPVIDPGVAAEIGYLAGRNNYGRNDEKAVALGLLTDVRDMSLTSSDKKNSDIVEAGLGESQYCYQNLFCIGAIKEFGWICRDVDSLIEKLREMY